MKKLCLILLALIFANFITASADIEDVSYVFDYAEVLNDATEGYIEKNSKELMADEKINLTVVTVEDKKIDNPEEYFKEKSEEFGIRDGIVIFLAEKVGYIATYSTESVKEKLSDEKLAEIRNDCIPGLQNGELDFDKAIGNLYRAVLVELDVDGIEKPVRATHDAFLNFISLIIFMAVFSFVLVVFFEAIVKTLVGMYRKNQ